MTAFTAMSPTARPISQSGSRAKLAEIDVHADREKEQAEQKALEGIDGGLDRLAEFRLGEQQAGDEGAERHREAGHARRPRRLRRSRTASWPRTDRSCRLMRPDGTAACITDAADNDDHAEREWRRSSAPAMSVATTEPASPVPKMEMKSRSGATARSCASKVAKLARPALVFSRPLSGKQLDDDGG